MNIITRIFHNNKAFIPYITAGDPTLELTEKLIYVLEDAGADAIELGIPFSDPIADGPVIQKAHQRALRSGTTLKKIFQLVRKVRKNSAVPLLFMMSYNSVVSFGQKEFVSAVKTFGVNGIIVPDLPYEESHGLAQELAKISVPLISFVAPTTSDRRMEKIVRNAHGFIYLISSTGVTGLRQSVTGSLPHIIKKIKQVKHIPVAVGFGISTPDMARETSHASDGVIVGSALVKIIEAEGHNCAEEVYNFAKAVKDALGGKH